MKHISVCLPKGYFSTEENNSRCRAVLIERDVLFMYLIYRPKYITFPKFELK